MKIVQRYILPALFGLLVYTSIRLVNDSMEGVQFWDRSWQQNTIEIVATILLGIFFSWINRYIIQRSRLDTGKLELKKIGQEFLLVFIITLVIFNPVLFIIHYLIKSPVTWKDFIIGDLLVILYVLLHYAFTRGYSLLNLYIKQNTEMETIKNEQLSTELKFLKAQYHPHFLFNALNTIYFQMDENITDAKKTVEHFAELLRYQLYEHQQMVNVDTELKYLNSFIQLQKARISGKLQLEVDFDESLGEEKIYPLILLPLLENAFKYVGGSYHLFISLKKEGADIVFRVENSVPELMPSTSGGIGLENLRRRLELLYPGKHHFFAERKGACFVALLKITVV
jgi:two-component system, LytTR family, sensor kinase